MNSLLNQKISNFNNGPQNNENEAQKKRKLSSAFVVGIKKETGETKEKFPSTTHNFVNNENELNGGPILKVPTADRVPTLDINHFLDADLLNEICFLCNESLKTFNDKEKEDHLNCCLDDRGIEQQSNTNVSERGLRCVEFFCVLCDVNLSRKKLMDRCLHLKKCAKDHQLSTKQLLQFISPDLENEEEDEDDCEEETVTNQNREKIITSKTCGTEIIDLLSDSEDQVDSHELKRAKSLPTAPPTPVKNAFSLLLESSRQQSSLTKGGFENKKRSSTIQTTLTSNSKSNNPLIISKPASGTTTTANDQVHQITPVSAQPKPQSGGGGGGGYGKFSRSVRSKKASPGTGNGTTGNNTYAPAYKKVQVGDMTYPIIVDGFQFASSLLSDCYFLTHFHSDHYTGLTQGFSAGNSLFAFFFFFNFLHCFLELGSIYCSQTTASLVKLKLKVSNQYLIPLELERKVKSSFF
jgi:hypothetical protein